GPGISKPSIRGLSYDRVVVYSQGVRLENQQWGDEHGIGVSTSGINSIEVIKGPSYVLYGSDAMGGVLYIEPERYSNDFSVDYMGLYNSNYNGITNNLGIKGSSGKFSYLARANMVDNQSFSTPDGEVENTWFKENDIQAGLKYETEKFSSDLRLSMNFSELGLPHMEEGHDDHEEEGHDDHDEEGHEGHEEGEAELDMELSTNTLDVSLVMPQSDNLNLTIGANFLSQENKNFGHEELIPDAEKKDFGLYALGQITMENGAALIGVRYDNRSISSDMGSADFSNFNGSVGIKRDFENSSLRFNIGSGYRAPNLIELFADGVHHGTFRYEKGNVNLVAEKSFQTDISFDINNEDSSVSFDLFYNDISDYIYVSPSRDRMDGFAVYNYMQQDSELYGGEISFDKKTGFDWLSYNTSLEYVFAESADGEALPFIAPLTFNQVFNIDFSSNYSFEIDFLAKAKQGRVAMFEEETDGYSVLNLSGNWMTSFLENDLNIFWSVNNVFDTEYYDHLSRFKTAGIEEMGRNISVGLKYKF
ncbi:TonB-dependent receptor, partial [bacterium]|nr:TonB-dependent receptor [bacterium]